jgi:hypothetical protein
MRISTFVLRSWAKNCEASISLSAANGKTSFNHLKEGARYSIAQNILCSLLMRAWSFLTEAHVDFITCIFGSYHHLTTPPWLDQRSPLCKCGKQILSSNKILFFAVRSMLLVFALFKRGPLAGSGHDALAHGSQSIARLDWRESSRSANEGCA